MFYLRITVVNVFKLNYLANWEGNYLSSTVFYGNLYLGTNLHCYKFLKKFKKISKTVPKTGLFFNTISFYFQILLAAKMLSIWDFVVGIFARKSYFNMD